MKIDQLLEQRDLTKYRLSKISGVPYTTVNEICNGKVKIEKCTADTVYRLSKALGVTMEAFIEDAVEYRSGFETFKSNVCHRVHDMGDMNFIIDTLESDSIRKYYDKQWYPESLYLLAMVDYLSRENDLPVCEDYSDIRSARLQTIIYPSSVLALCGATNSERPKEESIKAAIPEFIRFNIVESEVRNVI